MRVLLLSTLLSAPFLAIPPSTVQESPLANQAARVVTATRRSLAPFPDLLPPARGPLELSQLERGEGAPSVLSLAEAVAFVTGQQLLLSEGTRAVLARAPLQSLGGASIPPHEVYPFFESVLLHESVLLTSCGTKSAPLMALHLSNSPHSMLDFEALDVPPELLPQYADHPALLVRTLFHTGPASARELIGALSAPIARVPACSIQATSDRALLVTGPLRWVRAVGFIMEQAAPPVPRTVRSESAAR